MINPEAVFEKYFPGKIVLDIDMDVFSKEMAYITKDVKMKAIKKWTESADMISIATSPFFMDRHEAIQLVKDIIQE